MNGEQIFALIGASVLAFVIRLFNVVVEWLSRMLGVQPPDPIPTAHDPVRIPPVDHTAPSVVSSPPEAPDPSYQHPSSIDEAP